MTKRLLRTIILTYAALALLSLFFADSLIFHTPPPSYKDNPEIIKIKVEGNSSIAALYLSSPGSCHTILYSHGNGEDIGDVRPLLNEYLRQGFSVFAYDYRGYGISTGKPSEDNLYEDIVAAYNYLVEELQTEPGRIVAVGRSLGTAPSIHLASRKKVAGLILQSPFISAYRTITRYPLIPFDRFPNIKKMHAVDCPLLVVHGREDKVIPLRHGRTVYKKATKPKYHLWVEGAGHYDLLEKAGSGYWEAISTLVEGRPGQPGRSCSEIYKRRDI